MLDLCIQGKQTWPQLVENMQTSGSKEGFKTLAVTLMGGCEGGRRDLAPPPPLLSGSAIYDFKTVFVFWIVRFSYFPGNA